MCRKDREKAASATPDLNNNNGGINLVQFYSTLHGRQEFGHDMRRTREKEGTRVVVHFRSYRKRSRSLAWAPVQ